MSQEPDLGFYRKFLLLTITAVCLLILVGGIVRSTGSGMGCPDWPKCFGRWLPPIGIEELPQNYKEIYSLKRHQKNLKVASYFDVLGYKELADKLRTDQSIIEEETFNPIKTWTEYLNRLLGAIIGFLIFFNIIISYPHRKGRSRLLWLAVLNLVLVGFQGWVGSVVVSTHLLGGIITFHMLLALIILAVLIYNYWLTISDGQFIEPDSNLVDKAYVLIIVALILFIVQVVFGTQVRESIDLIAVRLGQAARADWISELGLNFYIHRSHSIMILAVHGYFVFVAYELFRHTSSIGFVYILAGLLLVEVLTGTIMAYFAIPPAFQPIHLLLATLIFGIDYYLLLLIGGLRHSIRNHDELNAIPK